MGCIRVDRIVEYLCDPLHLALRVRTYSFHVFYQVDDIFQDSDPYVRKTAAICVAKLYSINRELVIDRFVCERPSVVMIYDVWTL